MKIQTNPNNLFEANDEEMVVAQVQTQEQKFKTIDGRQVPVTDAYDYVDFESIVCAHFVQCLEEYIANREKTEFNFHGSLYILNEDKLGMHDRWEVLRQWCNRGCQCDDEIVQMYKNFQVITTGDKS